MGGPSSSEAERCVALGYFQVTSSWARTILATVQTGKTRAYDACGASELEIRLAKARLAGSVWMAHVRPMTASKGWRRMRWPMTRESIATPAVITAPATII